MASNTELSETVTRFPVDVRRFSWIKPLAADYSCDHGRVAEFFAGDPQDVGAWRETIARTQQHPRNREAIAEIVAAQQRARLAPPEALAASRRLADPRAVAVLTGQQAGLFGGPLYTLLKALTAVRLAEQVATAHQVPTLAIFWIDGEDHDWDEVKTCQVLDPTLQPVRVALGDPPGAGTDPVAWVRLDDTSVAAVDRLAAVLQPTEFTATLIDDLRRVYAPGVGMAAAFGRWLESLLGSRGLVVFDASDPAAKPLVGELFARELQDIGQTGRLATETGAALDRLGYHAQVTPHEGHAALFHIDGARAGIRAEGDRVLLGDSGTTRTAVLELARTSPERFSPNVLLRPLVQDTLFPTVCYVGGPSEIAYLGQLRRVYDAFGVPMPLLQPRASATIIDSNAMRFLQRNELSLESLRPQDESALNVLLKAQIPPAVEMGFDDASRAIAERMEALAETLIPLDRTLEAAARSALGRMQDDLRKLHAKIVQATKRKDDTLRRQFAHARAQAFPNGQPQEREIGFVYFLNRYGPALIDRLCDDLPLDHRSHWVLTI